MTIHVISVGVSLLDALRDRRRAGAGRTDQVDSLIPALKRSPRPGDLFDDVRVTTTEEAGRWLASALAGPDGPDHDPNAASTLTERAQRFRPDLWPREFSAELTTFAACPISNVPVGPDDTTVLICSDTLVGLLAGLWNAAALTGGDLTRIRYLPAPDTLPATLRGTVLITRVPGMDAASEAGFVAAMRHLGTLARKLWERTSKDKEQFEFYLSGGFKAAIPYLIGIAEGLRSLEGDRTVRAWVLHDTTDRPIRLPLRRIDPDLVRHELSDFRGDDLKSWGLLNSAILEGYAYEQDRHRDVARLTPFGAALQTLFDLPPRGLL